MLISRNSAPEQSVDWAHNLQMARRILIFFKYIKFPNLRIFETENHEFSNCAL